MRFTVNIGLCVIVTFTASTTMIMMIMMMMIVDDAAVVQYGNDASYEQL